MKDLGMMHYFLGLEVWQFLDEIFLNKGKYTVEILKRFGMLECKVMNTPMVTNLKLSKDDYKIYYKVENDGIMILLLYVDDLFLTGKENLINECKKNIMTEFEMKDLVLMHYFLGIDVWQYPNEIFLNQRKK